MNQVVLALETSAAGAEVALRLSNGETLQLSSHAAQQQNRDVPRLVQRALNDGGIELDDVAQVVVAIGPGSFTGIRIGISFAQGICLASRIPLSGVCSLVADGYEFLLAGSRVLVVRDARRGECFALELASGKRSWESDIEMLSINEVLERAAAPGVAVVSREPIPGLATLSLRHPQRGASALIDLAGAEEGRGTLGGAALAAVRPLYVRGVSARKIAERGGIPP